MGSVLVVTDSSTCLPPEVAASLGIFVLPISVYLPEGDPGLTEEGDEETLVLPEGAADDELAAASRPFVTEYLAAIESPGYEAAVVLTPAVEFATMYRNAALAAELAERAVEVVDTRTAAAGQALVALVGAEVANAGGSLDEVVAAVRRAAASVELVASLASLEPMRRAAPMASQLLGAEEEGPSRSQFQMRAGTVEPLGGPTDVEGALATIAALAAAREAHRIVVFHAGAAELATRLAAQLGGVEFISGFSIAMQVHTGRGVIGAAWLSGIAP